MNGDVKNEGDGGKGVDKVGADEQDDYVSVKVIINDQG